MLNITDRDKWEKRISRNTPSFLYITKWMNICCSCTSLYYKKGIVTIECMYSEWNMCVCISLIVRKCALGLSITYSCNIRARNTHAFHRKTRLKRCFRFFPIFFVYLCLTMLCHYAKYSQSKEQKFSYFYSYQSIGLLVKTDYSRLQRKLLIKSSPNFYWKS